MYIPVVLFVRDLKRLKLNHSSSSNRTYSKGAKAFEASLSQFNYLE